MLEMSAMLINRITIKKDGVYLSSKNTNDSIPFRSWRCDGLSEIYKTEGQKGLDREIIRMVYEYGSFRGNHKSLTRYRSIISSPKAHTIYQKYHDQINTVYSKLEQADQDSIWHQPTEKAKLFLTREKELMNAMYTEIATLCESQRTNK